MSIEWFGRFADIPGISYATPDGINRSKLKGASDRPEVISYGEGQEALSWRSSGGSTSSSPAQSRASDSDMSAKSPAPLVRHLYETLELPGQPRDYHFAIQSVVDELWKRRRQDPGVFTLVERLAWLDVDLVRARPDTVTNEHGDTPRFYRVTSFDRLITLYEREGAVQEALQVAEIAARFDQQEPKRDELAERLAAVAQEAP